MTIFLVQKGFSKILGSLNFPYNRERMNSGCLIIPAKNCAAEQYSGGYSNQNRYFFILTEQ